MVKKPLKTVWLGGSIDQIECAPDGSLWAHGRCIEPAPNGSMWWPEDKRIGYDKNGRSIPVDEPDDYMPHLACAPREPSTQSAVSEWRIQCQCAKIARQMKRADKNFAYEFLNLEGKRDMKRASILKMMGSEPGTLEVRLYYKRGNVLRMAVGDVKTDKGRVSPAQKAWLEYFDGTVVLGFIIRSAEDFQKMVEWVRK